MILNGIYIYIKTIVYPEASVKIYQGLGIPKTAL